MGFVEERDGDPLRATKFEMFSLACFKRLKEEVRTIKFRLSKDCEYFMVDGDVVVAKSTDHSQWYINQVTQGLVGRPPS
jgi:hypothetical protein